MGVISDQIASYLPSQKLNKNQCLLHYLSKTEWNGTLASSLTQDSFLFKQFLKDK